jgi:hypothetical protein
MGRETDKALELVQALTDEQRKQAILGSQMRDLVLGPGHAGETIQPEGLKTSTFDDGQRKLLLELIAEWSGIIHDDAAAAKLNEIKANLADTWFAWSGPLEAGKAYFRIQGPTVIIEYAPQKLGGDKLKLAVAVKSGVDAETAKKIHGEIKASKLKLQCQTQGDAVRITGAKRDELQAAMALLRKALHELPLSFNNFRS